MDTDLSSYLKNYNFLRRTNKQNSKPLPKKIIKKVFKKILKAVNYMHQNGVMHRDLKPGNILMSMCLRQVKVIDFGQAECIELCQKKKLDFEVGIVFLNLI
jgi:serine/threonine protein kinase